ncbi:Lrp/AsnC family transcriptional regulator [Pedobacter cryoconitis]|uniref:Lrp/AsnC family leucine-responsive transcriptional regulator/Lrp/AsnC family transcriptional regulator n=1 Tax=Pedobacter cryoconitis TaxID=188932 RepID=A0A327SLR0_9SPHI|nr:Lrp/AsnC family transcriptional regulator [Pedobacter cryoconitis]RAJ30230.1 Lrp/AsnC family leucine-responsive transcriptional regulator/Lrp/AsnC family transcriptional regulator [Pedobacter cryoconitis]
MDKKLDRIDICILKLLQENNSRPHKQIAGILKLSTTTICDRLKKLKAEGYIVTSVAVLNRRKLKQEVLAFIHLKLSHCSDEIIDTFKEEVSRIKEVCECCTITGEYNIKLKIVTTDNTSFSGIQRNIANIKNVQALESYVVLDTIMTDTGFHF